MTAILDSYSVEELEDILQRATPEERAVILPAVMPELEAYLETIRYDWRGCDRIECDGLPHDGMQLRHARPSQIPPAGDWLIWLVLAGRGFGKALALDTPIPTPSGWTTMGELSEGDWLFDEQGEPCQVTFATEIQLNRNCYRVEFDDGSSIIADEDHRWLTWDKKARKAHGRAKSPKSHPEVRTTGEIRDTLMCSPRERNHSIRNALSLRLPPADLPVDPYLLGVWLGDGTSRTAEITIGDGDADEMLPLLASVGGHVSGSVRRNHDAACATYPVGGAPKVRDPLNGRMTANDSLTSRLKALGVMPRKHIPNSYLRAAAPQRLALLQGLMDSDGSAATGGHVEFMSTVRCLSEGVYELAVSLGFKPAIHKERSMLNGKDCGPRFRVTWTTHEPVFRLKRKLGRLRTATAQANRTTHRYIVAVEPVPSVPVRCITVNSPSHLFLAGRAMVPTHNTRLGAETAKAWSGYNTDLPNIESMPGSRGAVVAATFADARDTCIEGESGLLSVLPPSVVKTWNRSMGELLLENGTRIKCFSAEEPERLRGPQFHWAWCDETAAWVRPETWDQLMFGLRLGTSPKVVVTSTPKPTKLIKDLNARETVHVTRGSTFENSANLAPAALDELRRRYEGTRLGDQELYAKILTDTPGALWTDDILNESRVFEVPRVNRRVLAIDPSDGDEKGDGYGVTVACLGEDGHGYVEINEEWHNSPAEMADASIELARDTGCGSIVVEKNHGGKWIPAYFHKIDSKIKVDTVWAADGKYTRAEPISAFFKNRDVSPATAHLVGKHEELEDQLTSFTGKPGEKSPDRLDSMVWALTALMLQAQRPKLVCR